MAKAPKPPQQKRRSKDHIDGTTNRPETPALEGLEPLPEEITGRASRVDENLMTLFDRNSSDHLVDGFQGGSGDVDDGMRDSDDGVTPRHPLEPEGTRD